MFQSTFNRERTLILREILDNYHYNSGIDITGDRCFIAHCPERLARLHYEFARLAIAYVPPEQEKDYMRELKRLHKALKIEYKKLERRKRQWH